MRGAALEFASSFRERFPPLDMQRASGLEGSSSLFLLAPRGWGDSQTVSASSPATEGSYSVCGDGGREDNSMPSASSPPSMNRWSWKLLAAWSKSSTLAEAWMGGAGWGGKRRTLRKKLATSCLPERICILEGSGQQARQRGIAGHQ